MNLFFLTLAIKIYSKKKYPKTALAWIKTALAGNFRTFLIPASMLFSRWLEIFSQQSFLFSLKFERIMEDCLWMVFFSNTIYDGKSPHKFHFCQPRVLKQKTCFVLLSYRGNNTALLLIHRRFPSCRDFQYLMKSMRNTWGLFVERLVAAILQLY